MKNLIEDKKAKSRSFFLNNEEHHFSKKHLNFLVNFYKKNKTNIRICLHKNKNSRHHDMIILLQNKNFYEPHKHLKKGETYHIIKGSMIYVGFSNKGDINKVIHLKRGDVFRSPVNKYHTLFPYSKFVIFHEGKIGPFISKNENIFPYWKKKFTHKSKNNLINNILMKNKRTKKNKFIL
jgi:cupin fold WbuC family metalloprotein